MLRLACVGLLSFTLVGCGHSGHGNSGHAADGHSSHGFCHDLHVVCKTARKAKDALHGHSHD